MKKIVMAVVLSGALGALALPGAGEEGYAHERGHANEG